MSIHIPLIYAGQTHRPMEAGEVLDPDVIGISQRPANSLTAMSDGLYSGLYLEADTYYVAASGTDAADKGTKASPYQTLGYALSQLMTKSSPNTAYFNKRAYIALKAGESFTLPTTFVCGGEIGLTFYGDSQYGDYDSAAVGTGADPAVMSDLDRPIILPQLLDSGTSITGIHLVGSGSVELRGIQVNLPISPNGATDACDFVIARHGSVNAQCSLFGSIINRLDSTSVYGAFGVQARARSPGLVQYASKFLLIGNPVVTGAAPAALTCRQWFIKFYKDYLGNNQGSGSLTTGVAGTAVMNLNWSEVTSLTVASGKTNQASYPEVFDPAFGIRNYFTNLTRDQQQRPQNVNSGLLF